VMAMTEMMSVKYYSAGNRVTALAPRPAVTSFLPQIVARGCILPSFVPVFSSPTILLPCALSLVSRK